VRAASTIGCTVLALLAGAAPGAVAAATVEVLIGDYRFTPAELRIAVGDTVRWVNREKRASHSVFFEAERLPESERLFPDESWERQFTEPGRYRYRCGPHPEMQGVILVE
jgi:plastocyanin